MKLSELICRVVGHAWRKERGTHTCVTCARCGWRTTTWVVGEPNTPSITPAPPRPDAGDDRALLRRKARCLGLCLDDATAYEQALTRWADRLEVHDAQQLRDALVNLRIGLEDAAAAAHDVLVVLKGDGS